MQKPVVYAHRGASAHAPENTLAAFRKGLEMGANGIETDVQLSKDGEVVIIHDMTLERTTNGSGYVRDHTLEQLQSLDAGAWYGEHFAGERIPTLGELFDLVRDRDIVINIELKNSKFPYKGLEERVMELIIEAELEERIILSSFNHGSLTHCKNINPNITTGMLYQNSLYKLWAHVRRVKADALHASFPNVNKRMVDKAHMNGLMVNVWTVNERADMKSLLHSNIDGIITDFPDRWIKIISEEVTP